MTSRWGAPDPRRLIRWYPRAWRDRHGEVLLATFAELSEARGGMPLSRADAWSMRVHGLAERLSPGVGAALALAGGVCLLFGVVRLVVGLPDLGPLTVLLGLVVIVVGPVLLSLSAAALVRDVGVTTAAQTVAAAAASVVAWAIVVLAGMSLGSGWEQADEGLEQSPFAAAFPVFLVGALVAGAVALAPVFAGVLRGVRSPLLRWAVAVGCGVLGVVMIGLVTMLPGGGLLVPLGLLVAWGLRLKRRVGRRGPDRTGPSAPAETPPRPGARARDQPHRGLIVGLALGSAVLAAPFSFVAVLGGAAESGWSSEAWAALPPINVGLTGGALASLPLVAAVGVAATSAWGRRGAIAGLLVGIAMVMSAVSSSMGPTGDTQVYLLFLAGAVVGVAVVIPAARWIPGPPLAQWTVVVVVGLIAGYAVGFMALAVFPLVAPIVAVIVALVFARRSRPPTVATGIRRPAGASSASGS